MTRTKSVSESVVIGADPLVVYEQISDPRNYGRWSPENVGATLLAGAPTGSYEGMEFNGHNRNNRRLRGAWNLAMPRWTTRCVVTAAEPSKRFAFAVVGQMMGGKEKPRLPFGIATWEYRLDELEGGTRLTETWTDDRDSSLFGRASRMADRVFSGGPTFPEFQKRNMRTTLDRIKSDLEGISRE